MVVTLTGTNDYLIFAELRRHVAEFVEQYGDIGLEQIDGGESDLERITAGIQGLSFLSPRKLLVLREPSKQKAFGEKVSDLLSSAGETTDIVIIEPKLDKRSTYYKTLKKQTDYREYGELDANSLARWMVDYVKEKGGSLSSDTARILIERLGLSNRLMQNELDKLLAFDTAITLATVELLTDQLPQGTIFELLDAAFAGKTATSLKLYREQRALRVEPQAVIAMLVWQLHVLALIKMAEGRSADVIASEARLNPFVVRKSQSTVRLLTLERLKDIIADLLRIDRQLKRTAIDADEVLELFLLNLGNH